MQDPQLAIHSDKVKAKSCPFCLKSVEPELEFRFNGEGPPPSYMVYCGWCGAVGPHGNGKCRGDHAGAKDNAIIVWNDRPRLFRKRRKK